MEPVCQFASWILKEQVIVGRHALCCDAATKFGIAPSLRPAHRPPTQGPGHRPPALLPCPGAPVSYMIRSSTVSLN